MCDHRINLSEIPPYIINRFESNNSLRRGCSSVTFKTWVRFPSAPPRKHMSFSDRLSILERLPSHQRMTARDNAGKKSKKAAKRKHSEEHYRKDWDKDLWE